MILTGISAFFIWLVSSPTGSLALSCVFDGTAVVAWNALSLVFTEIFPTEYRYTHFLVLLANKWLYDEHLLLTRSTV